MCENCGCGHVEGFKVAALVPGAAGSAPVHHHGHDHPHGHEHVHPHEHAAGTTVELNAPILAENDRLAERNRGYLMAKGVVALNFLSSPGSGKTTLLTATLTALPPTLPAAVINGDLATALDAEKLHACGVPVAHIATGTVCHLDAHMVAHGMDQLPLDGCKLLLIENVGNLVCPASYDLGEKFRIVLMSVTEGEDKPLKYPPIFHRADLILVTKIDLAEATGFDRAATRANLAAVAPQARVLELSARTGVGMAAWFDALKEMAGER